MNVVITGTSSGIGQSIATHLTSAGHHVWGLARHPSGLPTPPASTGSFQDSPCDVSSWDQLSSSRTTIQKTWPHIDALICCAAIQHPVGPAMSIDPADWIQNLNTNLTGTFLTIRAFHDLLLQSPRHTKVICFSGGGATSPRPLFTPYAVAKAGVVRLVENLSSEWASSQLQRDINAIAPGPVNTRMTGELVSLGPEIAGAAEFQAAASRLNTPPPTTQPPPPFIGLTDFLLSQKSNGISGRLISAPWDPWPQLDQHLNELNTSDIYTLRRITPKDRNLTW